jgi:hypothetical protein
MPTLGRLWARHSQLKLSESVYDDLRQVASRFG